MSTNWVASLKDQGYCIVDKVLEPDDIRRCIEAIDLHRDSSCARSRRGGTYAMRNLLSEVPLIGQIARSSPLRSLVDPILGMHAIPVRSILFDKSPQVNWSVPWHQDCAIAVRERIETAGFGPWSVKAGVPHVEPPAHVLESMVTLRIHLDDCDESNGPLRVVPGSHCNGKLDESEIATSTNHHETATCCVPAGGVLMMRPLILHASSQVSESNCRQHRRVVHIEYANARLPGGLRWVE